MYKHFSLCTVLSPTILTQINNNETTSLMCFFFVTFRHCSPSGPARSSDLTDRGYRFHIVIRSANSLSRHSHACINIFFLSLSFIFTSSQQTMPKKSHQSFNSTSTTCEARVIQLNKIQSRLSERRRMKNHCNSRLKSCTLKSLSASEACNVMESVTINFSGRW